MVENDRIIQDQVKLPARVAFGVVLQGIRIRFGRSLVTLSGVALGIAFLMSIFTGQVIKEGVSEETNIRIETEQMRGFLVAEMGAVSNRHIGVIQIGQVNEIEKRFLMLLADKRGNIKYTTAGSQSMPSALQDVVKSVPLDEVAVESSAIILVGAPEEELTHSWNDLFTESRQRVIALTRKQSHDWLVFGLVESAVGSVQESTIGIIQIGSLNPAETRLVKSLQNARPKVMNWALLDETVMLADGIADASIQVVDRSAICSNADVVLLVGSPPAGVSDGWAMITPAIGQKVFAPIRRDLDIPWKNITTGEEYLKGVALEREVTEEESLRIAADVKKGKFRSIWIIVISLLVTVIGISNAMLMSVTERFREIGTMKCLGALSSFIRQIFLIESSLVGLVGSTIGAIFGVVFSTFMYCMSHDVSMVFGSMDFLRVGLLLLLTITIGMVLSIIAALYPARFASRMVPATALRSNI